MAETLDRAGAMVAACAPITLAQRMAAYEVLRSIAEADLNGTPRPAFTWRILGSALDIAAIDFGLPAHEAYAFIRDSIANQVEIRSTGQLTLKVA